MQEYINQCQEGSNISKQIVSHFFKFADSQCVCVFCGKKIQINAFNTSETLYNTNSNTSVIGLRS